MPFVFWDTRRILIPIAKAGKIAIGSGTRAYSARLAAHSFAARHTQACQSSRESNSDCLFGQRLRWLDWIDRLPAAPKRRESSPSRECARPREVSQLEHPKLSQLVRAAKVQRYRGGIQSHGMLCDKGVVQLPGFYDEVKQPVHHSDIGS